MTDMLTREKSLEIAAQCWCDYRVHDRVMDTKLAEVFADTIFFITNPGAHYCTEWDFLLIAPDEPEWDACLCHIKDMYEKELINNAR